MAEPKIYSRNYLGSTSTITLSHGGTASLLYDRDVSTRFTSLSANNDAVTMTIYISLSSAGFDTTKSFDTIALLNHNLKSWSFSYWTSFSGWTAYTSETNDTKSNTVKTFSPLVWADTLKLEATATNDGANNQKRIGELILMDTRANIGVDMSRYDATYRQKFKQTVLGDGTLHTTVVRPTSGRTQKYEARVQLDYVPLAMRDTLYAIKNAGEAVYWQPESVTRPEQIYYCQWANPWAEKYVSSYKGAGFSIQIDFKEV